MNQEQTERFLKIIKSYYSYFSITDEVIYQFTKKLSNYEYNDVLEQLDKYVDSGEREAPTLSELIHPLKTISQKEKTEFNGYDVCSMCGKRYATMREADECYERDMDIKYIKKLSLVFQIDTDIYFKPHLDQCSLEEINKNYNKFILRVIDEEKKKRLLSEKELRGLRAYYKNVIVKELKNAN